MKFFIATLSTVQVGAFFILPASSKPDARFRCRRYEVEAKLELSRLKNPLSSSLRTSMQIHADSSSTAHTGRRSRPELGCSCFPKPHVFLSDKADFIKLCPCAKPLREAGPRVAEIRNVDRRGSVVKDFTAIRWLKQAPARLRQAHADRTCLRLNRSPHFLADQCFYFQRSCGPGSRRGFAQGQS